MFNLFYEFFNSGESTSRVLIELIEEYDEYNGFLKSLITKMTTLVKKSGDV